MPRASAAPCLRIHPMYKPVSLYYRLISGGRCKILHLISDHA